MGDRFMFGCLVVVLCRVFSGCEGWWCPDIVGVGDGGTVNTAVLSADCIFNEN